MTDNPPATDGPPPNVIVVLADDMGWGDLSCYGATKFTTPAMDRVAAEGVRATDCHAASAVCSPSRYALLTGRYSWRSPLKNGVLFGHSPAIIEPDRPTLASVLGHAGYATGAFGKWHLGLGWHFEDGRVLNAFEPGTPLVGELKDGTTNVDYEKGFEGGPTALGFDRFFGMSASLDMAPYCFLDQDAPLEVPDREKEQYFPPKRRGMQSPGWRDDLVDVRFTEEACSWIREQVSAGSPFFTYLATSAPHTPHVAPDFAVGRSGIGPRGDLVWTVDWVVGQLLDLLDELGIADNTLIVVTSDNGAHPTEEERVRSGHRANGCWRGQKADIWEAGHRVPFVARWPHRIPAGTVSDSLLGLIDLMATIASATGATIPDRAAEDSADMLDVLTGRASRDRPEPLVHHSLNGTFGIRSDEWKLIMGSGSGGFSEPFGRHCDFDFAEGQLYNLARDPRERDNRWDRTPATNAELYDKLKRVARGPASGLSFDVPVQATGAD